MLRSFRPRITDTRLIQALRAAIGYCEICGAYPAAGERAVHHCRPRGAGGGDTLDNLIVVCPVCHLRLHQGLMSRSQLLDLVNERNLRIATAALKGRSA
jgi:predicted HNH restriction endonuclease